MPCRATDPRQEEVACAMPAILTTNEERDVWLNQYRMTH